VVVPYVDGMLHPGLVTVVKLSGCYHRFCQLDRTDEAAYGRLVRRLWRSQTDVILVEHDVVPTCSQLDELTLCGHDWCGFNYDDGLYPDGPMFGCVRLSRRLMVRHPRAAEAALSSNQRPARWNRMCDDAKARAMEGWPWTLEGERKWWAVDNAVASDLLRRGEHWVAHDGRVAHHHAGAPSGPV
jgi:hypothetical protein